MRLKPRKSETIHIRIDESKVKALDKLANEHGLNRSRVVEMILDGRILTSEDLRRTAEQLQAGVNA